MTDTRLFGEAAFEMELVSTAQLYEALTVQAKQEVGGGSRQFLGEILVELGYLNEKQVLEVLTQLHGSKSSRVQES
ncbi:MAG: hypothetical protein AAF581_04005 [Planctomycetota bacterium]